MKKLIMLRLGLTPLNSRTTRLPFIIFALIASNTSGWQLSECACRALLHTHYFLKKPGERDLFNNCTITNLYSGELNLQHAGE